jgi:hypothetical protein
MNSSDDSGAPQPTEPTGRPGKYQRSAGGLVAALVLTAVAVVVVMWVLGLFRNDLEIDPEEVDYLDVVAGLQEAGEGPVYPASLPDGWIATEAIVPVEEGGGFELDLLRDDEDAFIGIRQASGISATGLLTQYVEEDADNLVEGDPIEVDSVAPEWDTWTDEGGDTAYVAELCAGRRTETVIVYGSASPEELQDVLELLTTDPVKR